MVKLSLRLTPVLLSLFSCLPLTGQPARRVTSTPFLLLQSPTSNLTTVMMLQEGSGSPKTLLVQIDLAQFKLDRSVWPPVLRPNAPPAPVALRERRLTVVTPVATSYALPEPATAGSVFIHMNGLLQRADKDYTVGSDNQTITWKSPLHAASGYEVEIVYRY